MDCNQNTAAKQCWNSRLIGYERCRDNTVLNDLIKELIVDFFSLWKSYPLLIHNTIAVK